MRKETKWKGWTDVAGYNHNKLETQTTKSNVKMGKLKRGYLWEKETI